MTYELRPDQLKAIERKGFRVTVLYKAYGFGLDWLWLYCHGCQGKWVGKRYDVCQWCYARWQREEQERVLALADLSKLAEFAPSHLSDVDQRIWNRTRGHF